MKKRIVIYARYSSDKQTEQSIEGQLNVCLDYAKRNDMVVVHHYIDRALTGTTDKRPEFLKMIEDSKKKNFDYVLVYQLDRFARNRFDSATYKQKLKKNNVKVLSARENISDDASGILVEGLLESMAEYYSVELSQKVSRGMLETIKKGHFTGGRVPYGYDIVDKKYVINENEANIVRKVFIDYLEDKQMKDIAIDLNDSGFRTKINSDFSVKYVSSLLHCKKFIGLLGSDDLEGLIPSIVDRETFDIVQEKLKFKNNKPAHSKAKDLYYLSGKTFCGHCDALITAECGTSKSKEIYHYYKCSNIKKRIKKCEKTTIRKEKLEQKVIDRTLNILQNEELVNEISKNIVNTFNEEIKENLALLSLNKQLQDINAKTNSLLKAAEQGFINKTSQSRMLELENEKDLLEGKIMVENTRTIKQLTIQEVKDFLNSFIYADYSLEHNRERLINLFIRKVVLYNDRIIFFYNGSKRPDKELLLNKKTESELVFEFGRCGSPKGNRTPESALRGRHLNRLTIGPCFKYGFVICLSN